MKKIENLIKKELKQITEIGKIVDEDELLLDAYLYRSRTRCGKVSCRCMTSDYRHESWCVSFTENGQSKTKTIPLELLSVTRQMTTRYRELRKIRKQLLRISQNILDIVDNKTDSSLKSGRTLFKELVKKKSGHNK